MRRLSLPLLACLALVAVGCGGDGDDDGSTSAAPDGTATATATETGCEPVSAPQPKQVDERRPGQALERGAKLTATLETNCGTIPIALDTERQPKTAASFAQLVRNGVYDGLGFHRVVPGFVVQGGDPAGNETGGPGYSVVERPPARAAYTRGVVAMAKTEIERPGTSGSQFFIVTAEDAGLPPDYAIVGEVTGDGMAAVDRIEAIPTNAQQVPDEPVVIERATLSEG